MTETNKRTIGLVSCVKTKQDSAAIPKELYTSNYFNLMQDYAEQYCDEWYVLSAEHGVLDPDGEPVEPYEKTLRTMGIGESQDWAAAVVQDLDERGVWADNTTVEIHAGAEYTKPLLEELDHQDPSGDFSTEQPVEGLMIGKRMAWYSQRSESQVEQ